MKLRLRQLKNVLSCKRIIVSNNNEKCFFYFYEKKIPIYKEKEEEVEF